LLNKRTGIAMLAGVTLVVTVAARLAPRVAQPLAYHNFADQRRWLGIPNFADVASNLAFAIVGVWGWVRLREPGRIAFVGSRERWPYVIVFAGMVLVAMGSSYYHLAPDNGRLVWDRLPMTVVFMSLVAATIIERISVRTGLMLGPVLLGIGIASVCEWHWSEVRGAGDLRFYAAVQVYAIVALLVILLLPPRYTRGGDLLVVVGFYVLAKLLETFDRAVFAAGHIVSGHTLKHLAAACAGWWILRMLTMRSAVHEVAEPSAPSDVLRYTG
jgi:hypothetical protein